MARKKRSETVKEGSVNHCTWRSHNFSECFPDDECKIKFLQLLGFYKLKYGILIFAYCLMRNHPHVVVKATLGQLAFSAFWRDVNSRYATWFNKRMNRAGNLVMERMKSPSVDPEGVLSVMRYGDLNPVRKSMSSSPKRYEFSSYAHYAYGEKNDLIDDAPEYLALGATPEERQRKYRASFIQHVEFENDETAYLKQPLRKRCTHEPILIIDHEWLFELVEENKPHFEHWAAVTTPFASESCLPTG